jgi:hypothetical protein
MGKYWIRDRKIKKKADFNFSTTNDLLPRTVVAGAGVGRNLSQCYRSLLKELESRKVDSRSLLGQLDVPHNQNLKSSHTRFD